MLPFILLFFALACVSIYVCYLYFKLASKNKNNLSSFKQELERKKYEASVIRAMESQLGGDFNISKFGEVLINSVENVLEHNTSSYLFILPSGKLELKTFVKNSVSTVFSSEIKKKMIESLSCILDKDISKNEIEENFSGKLLEDNDEGTLGDYFHIPLILNDKPVGIFTIASKKKDLYNDEETNLFYATTNRVLNVISKVEDIITKERESREKKEKEAERRAYQAEVLRELGERVGYSLDLAKIVEIISGSIGKLLEYSTISYMVQDKDRIVFKCNIEESVSRDFVSDIKSKMLEAFSAMLDKELNPDHVDESITGSVYDEEKKNPVASFFNLPLVIDQKVVGLINVASPKVGLYTEEETSILYTITSQASTAVTKLTEVLEREKGKLNALVASLEDGIIMIDPNWNLLVVNTRARSMLGLPTGTEITVLDVFDKLSGKIDIRTKIEEANSTDSNIASSEIAMGNQFLEVFTLRVKGKNSENFGAVISFHDITHEKEEKAVIEKKVEERTRQLAEEQSRFIAAINSIPRGFIIVDTNKQIVVTNHVLSDIFEEEGNHQWTMDDLGKKLNGVYDILGNYYTCLKEKKSINEASISLGSKILRIFLAPIALEGNTENIIGVVILIDDITEATVMERSKDEFFSIASHELRTPLTAIKGNATLIQDYYADQINDKEISDMVSDIRESSTRLIGIVNDFLDMSRLEQKKIEFKNIEFKLHDFISDVFKEVRSIAEEKKLYLEAKIPDDLPDIFADKDKVKQILINLIGNSLKFTQTGGVTVSANKDDKFIKVLITDTGRGIPIQNQRFLFRKFQQAGSSILTRDTTKGTGLGLYISRLMAEGMGGNISLEKSEEGKGSTFTLLLPIRQHKDSEEKTQDGAVNPVPQEEDKPSDIDQDNVQNPTIVVSNPPDVIPLHDIENLAPDVKTAQ